jgi:D-beta-D-heptose 7-phosphate kinase / D-beta-D-heptose 1-phosphate adenosyltransferase
MADVSAALPILERFPRVGLAVLGDLMLDRFVYGSVERISPEAPIPIFAVERESAMPGGAANVARNALALGARVILSGVVGADPAGQELLSLFTREPNATLDAIIAKDRRTTVKTRFTAAGQQMLRADEEQRDLLDAAAEAKLLARWLPALETCNVIALSDYAKGVLTPGIIAQTIARARELRIPVIVDPKASDFKKYAGATMLTPNAKELSLAVKMPVGTDAEAEAAARAALALGVADAILVTRSDKGVTLVPKGGAAFHIPAVAKEVFDVSGAGDTALSVLALALGAGASMQDAAALANLAAGIAVGKAGTAVVRPDELLSAALGPDRATQSKIRALERLADDAAGWRARGLKIGFTNGCFDILHAGHVSLLRQARGACDRLIVAVNTDDSIRRLKGPARPVNAAASRAQVLEALEFVDRVIFFAVDTPMALIEGLRPDVLIKGADYAEDQVVGGTFVKSYGGRIALIPLTPDHSTTGIIKRAKLGESAS